jgi:hypothetical protein
LKDVKLGYQDTILNGGGFIFFTINNTAPLMSVLAGTVFGGSTYIENSALSKANIMDTYYKDYRYSNKGNITINGIDYDASTFNTIRNIIEFPDVEMKLDSFPTSISSLDWGGGVKSFITELNLQLDGNKTIVKSRLLDI